MSRLELPEVDVPKVNGWSLMMDAVLETYQYLFPVLILAWRWGFSGVFTPFLYCWSHIAGPAHAVYNFKLPPTTVDMNQLPIIGSFPTVWRELPSFGFHSVPSVAIVPFGQLPVISHVIRAVSNISDISLIGLKSAVLAQIHNIVPFIVSFYNESKDLRGRSFEAKTAAGTLHAILFSVLNLCFNVPFEELDQYMATLPMLGVPFFVLRYFMSWIMWPVLIIIHGSWAILTTYEAFLAAISFGLVPVFLKTMEMRGYPFSAAFWDFIKLILFFVLLVSTLCFLIEHHFR
jgi:hypothetical protein